MAIIYTRFSPRPDAETCDSCEKQEARCMEYCKRKGYEVTQVFSDRDISGGLLDRPVLSEALKALVPCCVLVVDSADRLARDMLVSLTIRHEVERAGATVEFADGSPATTTPEGKLVQNILAAFAAYERDRIRFRTSRGLKRRQANGEWFGKPPIGWMRDQENSKRLVVCQQEQDAISAAISMADRGCTSDSIAAHLTVLYGSCRGKPWSGRTVRRILRRRSAPQKMQQ